MPDLSKVYPKYLWELEKMDFLTLSAFLTANEQCQYTEDRRTQTALHNYMSCNKVPILEINVA